MAVTLNNVATTDDYGAATTIEHGPFTRLNIEVNNASVYVELGVGRGAGTSWDAPEFFVRAGDFRSYDRVFSGVRVRSATPGKPARVTVVALTKFDTGEA